MNELFEPRVLLLSSCYFFLLPLLLFSSFLLVDLIVGRIVGFIIFASIAVVIAVVLSPETPKAWNNFAQTKSFLNNGHMGVYDIRGTLLASLLLEDPTIWGSILGIPDYRTHPYEKSSSDQFDKGVVH